MKSDYIIFWFAFSLIKVVNAQINKLTNNKNKYFATIDANNQDKQ